MEQENVPHSPSRLDRMEAVLQEIVDRQHLIKDDFARLLQAQERLALQAKDSGHADESFRALAASGLRMEAALKKLRGTVNKVLRPRRRINWPPPN
jgi:hypothetical protein